MIDQSDIIYFVITDRFYDGNSKNNHGVNRNNHNAFHGGDFDGLVKKIPYFKKLGITAIWITPVYLNINDFFDSAGYHGYWAIDFEIIDPHLYTPVKGRKKGSKKYLKDLVDKFHEAGLKVILDMVVNHTGYHTPNYKAYPHKVLTDKNFNNGSGMVEGELNGLPDIDHDQTNVSDYFIQNIIRWIKETGIDGIRMDTVKHVEDRFWYLFKAQVRTKYPDITLIGEVLDSDTSFIGYFQQVHDFNSIFDFPLCAAIRNTMIYDYPLTSLARPRIRDIEPAGALDRDKSYTNPNRLVTLLDSHDSKKRIMSEILDHVGHWDLFLARDILKIMLTFLFTTRGIPQVYYGTEIAMQGYLDVDSRTDMPWNLFGNNNEPLDNLEIEKEIFNHFLKMVEIRKTNPAICYGYLITLYVNANIYAYLREFESNIVIVVIHNGRNDMEIPVDIPLHANDNIPSRIKMLLKNGKVLPNKLKTTIDIAVDEGSISILLKRKSAGVYCI